MHPDPADAFLGIAVASVYFSGAKRFTSKGKKKPEIIREHQEEGKVAFPQNQQGCRKEGGNG